MPWNSIRPYLSHYAYGQREMPAGGWPATRVWITRFNRDALRLRTTRLWQLAPLRASFREWAERPELVFEVSQMAVDREQAPFALVYKFWSSEQAGLVVDEGGELVMRGVHHTISLTDSEIRMHCLPKHAFSWIVDTRNGRDPATYRPLAILPQHGPIPPEDVAALEGLV